MGLLRSIQIYGRSHVFKTLSSLILLLSSPKMHLFLFPWTENRWVNRNEFVPLARFFWLLPFVLSHSYLTFCSGHFLGELERSLSEMASQVTLRSWRLEDTNTKSIVSLCLHQCVFYEDVCTLGWWRTMCPPPPAELLVFLLSARQDKASLFV